MIIGAGQDDFARYVREISPIQENICYDDHLLLGNDIGLHAGGDDMIEKISEEEGVDISKGWSNPGTAATLLLALRRWRHLATIKYDEIVDFRFGKAGDLIFMVPGAEAWQGDFSGVRVFNPFV